jgi:hypothetical protein
MVCGPDGLVLFVAEKTALEPAGDGHARTSFVEGLKGTF